MMLNGLCVCARRKAEQEFSPSGIPRCGAYGRFALHTFDQVQSHNKANSGIIHEKM